MTSIAQCRPPSISRLFLRRRRHWFSPSFIFLCIVSIAMIVYLRSSPEESLLLSHTELSPTEPPPTELPQTQSIERRAIEPQTKSTEPPRTELPKTKPSRTKKPLPGASIEWCRPLQYRSNPEAWPVVALASYTGSGNTWLRYLLMQATGIYAGSICEDIELKRYGFLAEQVQNSSVIVVKTHGFGNKGRAPFDRAVLLVRSPRDAILAEFNRKSKHGHTGIAPDENFTKDNGEVWREFVHRQINSWRNVNLGWLDYFDGPLHVVLYEELQTNLAETLRLLTDFLETPVPDDVLKCVLERQEGPMHRKHVERPMDPFTDEMKEWIRIEQPKVYDRIQELALEKKIKIRRDT